MTKYRKKPVVVEAFRLGYDDEPDWFKETYPTITLTFNTHLAVDARCEVNTSKGDVTAFHGDFIIKDEQGEIYPCKAFYFEEKYEKVTE